MASNSVGAVWGTVLLLIQARSMSASALKIRRDALSLTELQINCLDYVVCILRTYKMCGHLPHQHPVVKWLQSWFITSVFTWNIFKERERIMLCVKIHQL